MEILIMSAATIIPQRRFLMNKKLIFSLLLAVCLLAIVSVVVFGQASSNVRWEYTTFDSGSLSQEQIREQLNTLGQQGWDLVTVTRDKERSSPSIMVFKRRL
jgi:hypothetical protein